MARKTLYDKIWDSHVVKSYPDGDDLLYVDRHLVQEVSSPQAFATLDTKGMTIRRPEAHLAVADHAVPTRRRGAPVRRRSCTGSGRPAAPKFKESWHPVHRN